ncbi:unnamed protein product [Symbiodinium sp. CCMP2592]|nr:unnamed protein product [Symbiodinium sp. CCMP2592]
MASPLLRGYHVLHCSMLKAAPFRGAARSRLPKMRVQQLRPQPGHLRVQGPRCSFSFASPAEVRKVIGFGSKTLKAEDVKAAATDDPCYEELVRICDLPGASPVMGDECTGLLGQVGRRCIHPSSTNEAMV